MNSRFVSGWRACFCLFVLGGTAASAQDPAKVPEVPVARPVLRAVVDYEVFAGRTEAATRVDLRPRVTGYLLKAPFQEGAEVKQGDVLFEIDARLHRAELDKADAALVQAEARLKLAEANQKRVTDLVARGVAPKEDLDKAVAERANAEAGVHLAKAGCDVARLNLEYTRVLAPVSGHIGRRLVDPGNLVKGDETLLATIVTQDPLYVFFDVDERTFLQVMQSRRQGLKGEKLPVAIALANEVGFPHLGAVDFIDNQVNPETGTIRMRAVLANKDKRLAPGMFVRARLPLSAPFQALLLPDQAVMAEDGARFVFIVNDKDVLERRAVKLGQHQD
ncbi:MAG TPA: efflux RND transporter periplasmic adaptor subunit, partial [Gemmataceae bacterium]|nr:efflux RND transporter periplasmic adaptor subunit [Gemmataceae bacterium]